MAVKVAINGFGRIGRLAFRQMFGHEGSEIVAINDLTSPDMLAYLLKYDSTQGNYARDHEVVAGEDSITVDGKEIKIYKEADANNLPWGDLDVDVVLECTGFYTSKAKAQAHINAGAKKVLISAPAKDETTPTIVFGVNHETLKASDVIVSAGSCTTNSMAAINTIPHSTGAAKAIGKVVPSVNGKLQGHAQRIQVPDGSVTELTTVLNKEVTADEINAAFKAAFSDTDFYGYNEDGIVSSDIIGDTHGGVFDPTQTDVNTVDGLTMARTVSWYDNEYGFTCNMVRTLLYFAEISE